MTASPLQRFCRTLNTPPRRVANPGILGRRRAQASGKEDRRERRSGLFAPLARVMRVEETVIPAVKVVTPKKHGEARGFFSEVYNKGVLESVGLHLEFVQDNHSFS